MNKEAFLDIQDYPEFLGECVEIYEASFPAWEREDIDNIIQNIKDKTYKIFAYLVDNKVIGFFILDINRSLEYTLFSFLAIKESRRGMGFGSKLCLYAIEYFKKNIATKWLLIEAQEREAKLYKKIGFQIIIIEYKIPSFTSNNSISMCLMKLQKSATIDKISLLNIIRDIFTRGYSLNENDARIREQLLKIV